MKLIKFSVTFFLILIVTGSFYTLLTFKYPFTDCVLRTILYPFEGTLWSSNHYNDNNFSKIKNGMTKKEVLDLVGKPEFGGDPDETNTKSEVARLWDYTHQQTNPHAMTWHRRGLVFDEKNLVIEIKREFYID